MSSLKFSMIFVFLLSLSSSLFTFTNAADPTFLYQICSEKNLTRNSTYQSNINLLLSSLPSKANGSDRFSNATTGQDPDKVYGLFQCRGDVTTATCKDCVAFVSKNATQLCPNQNAANTKRVVGTYGYMAPEYAIEGLFSVKSDVFSFRVILLEIISGKRNSGFYRTGQAPTLLAYAWQLWNEGKELEFVDPCLIESCSTTEVLRCIQIGLLCVQEDPASRPTMSYVVALLESDQSIAVPQPRQPSISVSRIVHSDESSTTNQSINGMTVSSISPR